MKIGLGDPLKNLENHHQRPKFKMAVKMLKKIKIIGYFSYSV